VFGLAAVVLFMIAFIVNGSGSTVSSAWFTPTSLMLAGLACLAVHLLGYASAWRLHRPRRGWLRR
jgi:hypothetical protein